MEIFYTFYKKLDRKKRGAGDPHSAPVRSASFLQKTREISERARQQAGVQDDSVLFTESHSSGPRMKPRQRRIESFHGGRRSSGQTSSSLAKSSASALTSGQSTSALNSGHLASALATGHSTSALNSCHSAAALTSSTNASIQQSSMVTFVQDVSSCATLVTSSVAATSGKPVLKGWATENDLSSSRKPVIMSGSQRTRNVQLSSAKSSPSLNKDEATTTISGSTLVATPRGYSPRTLKMMTKSTTDITENLNTDSVTSPTSPKSPTWYQQRLPNKGVFDFSSSSSSRRSPSNSYAGASPRNSYAGGSPQNSYAGGSPRNSYASYSSASIPQSVTGFSPMSVPNSSSYNQQSDLSRSGEIGSYNQKLSGEHTSSYDDTATHNTQTKSYNRRSLPPQALHHYRQEYQRESVHKTESQKQLTSMPVTQEERDADREIRDIKPLPPNDLDIRPMYSPPAPPVRDISSLKYVKLSQNHEKYPSWPVTTAQKPQSLGPPIDSQLSDKSKDSESGSEKSDKSQQSQYARVRSSPSIDKKGSDENKTRNQSDPGLKKPKKSFYTTRKPIEPNYENTKMEGERFDEFCKASKPGYPPPNLDPDGHNYGDEKYSIPSPPERDVPGIDEKSLVEKIAAVISPHSQHHQPSHHTFQYNMAAEHSSGYRSHRTESATSPMWSSGVKIPGTYFQQAMNAQNLLRSNNPQTMVDSGTSPIHSPNTEKTRPFARVHTNSNKSESTLSPSDNKPKAIVITQRPYYNTSTQTDESLVADSGHQGSVSLTSVSSGSTIKSDPSSRSSGIGSMAYSDQSSAGMMRKLSEEFYRGKLSGLHLNEKRMSSASAYDNDLKSQRSDGPYGVLKEAESCNSVVIHAHESAGLFGRDDIGSSPTLTSSHPEMSDNEHDHSDYRHKQRYSMDADMVLHKATGSMSISMPPRSLQDSRFTSESNLSPQSGFSQRSPHSQSLLQLHRPSSSLGDGPSQNISQSSHSSSSSRPYGSMEARSSGSRISSASSAAGDARNEKSRTDSDSVFYDGKVSPALGNEVKKLGNNGKVNEAKAKSGSLCRNESMKMAYGTFDESEHHYATPYGHQRNTSEVLSTNSGRDSGVVHGRSMSLNDYLPMHGSPADASRLGQIQEESSEIRWQEAVRKSKSLSRETASSNYENINVQSKGNVSLLLKTNENVKNENVKNENVKNETEKKRSGMRRTVSEQFKPNKERQREKHSDSSKGGYTSSSGESSKGNKSDSENVSNKTISQHQSDSDLKKVQQEAVLDFMKRKQKGSDSSDPTSPQVKDTAPEFPPPPIPGAKSPVSVATSHPPVSPLSDITKRYNYTTAQRNESLRRTQSITSNSSRDSDYMEMKRSYQTEWSRLRSQDSKHPRRPLSFGSDIGGLDGLLTPLLMTPDSEVANKHLGSGETIPKHIEAAQATQDPASLNSCPTSGDEGSMVTAPIYHNVGGDYPRRPPPPVPGVSEDAPPALPPRCFNSSKSESFLLARMDPSQHEGLKDSYSQDTGVPSSSRGWEGGGTGTLKEDAYAQQLRRQARRFSEQHKPVGISMQVVSTKSTVQVSLSQSYKQEQASAMEVKPVMRVSPQTSPCHTEVNTATILLQSPPASRGRTTPEPPPMPTPMKNGEVEVPSDLNKTADFPPPLQEFVKGAETSKDDSDRCADDSYGYYKTQSPREVGKYKRTTSDTSLLHTRQEIKTFQLHPDLDRKDVADMPNKPPRKKLEGRDSPNLALISKSPSVLNGDRKATDQRVPPVNSSLQPAEVTSVQHAVKSVANPLSNMSLQNSNSPTGISSSSGNFVDTVVQRPRDRNSLTEEPREPRQSVKDRVKNIEVFSHSPGSSKGGSQHSPNNGPGQAFCDDNRDSSFDSYTSDSLEQLESSAIQSDNLKDRLRPVVKKGETSSVQPESLVLHRLSVDSADHMTATPPAVPHRTYKQQPSSSSAAFRRDSFQNRGPRSYDNKATNSANIHNPHNQNHIVNTSRSPGKALPEPQVPSRSHKPRYQPITGGDQLMQDQNSNLSSPDLNSRVVSNYSENESVQNINKENTLVHSVQGGQKRNYQKSFSPRTRSGSSSGNSDHQNVATFHNRSHSDKQQGGTTSPQRQDHKRNHHHSEQRHSHDLRLPQGHSKNSPSSQSVQHKTSDQSPSDNHNSQRHDKSKSMNNKRNINDPSYQIHHHTDNKDDQNKRISPHTTLHSEVVKEHHSAAPHATPEVVVNHGRQPSAEELECDQKAQELAKVLQDSDKELSEVLQVDSKKNRMQFLDGILPVEPTGEERRPRSASKKEEKSSEGGSEETEKEPTSPMPSNYYVSPPKAMIELEIRKLSDNNHLVHDIADNDTLAQKKEELLQRMVKKVDVLKEDKKELLTDIDENEALGKQVIEYVESKCRSQQEKDKYRSYIEDIDKIIRLLLKLSGLLARAENTIQGLSENTNEKIRKMTYDKRDRLYSQHEDAKQLKHDIDRRSEQVEMILQSCLATNELDDYHYYIKMKSKYTIQLQELEDKITLGNEQIVALQKSIPNKK
ncbi:uncharacterized protein LOC128227977 isoform X3 [Mya arenaria]|uniref:uncharacterized protein LOC128227977 isoform X3 n=1 Tax=Mya arenaria TaxID=6604 RepID=UPI0022DFEECF|nr:uncharacterized protein LOC128227977 isoform X3 [Mya arenaria]